ncbi:hypothetical protein ABZS88_40270 [Streptomyces sp. NPDC005480]|uniref:hypothetical protein n=1 Tax=Streptomyces sp. NPDC005480 TaxID=3154880 RepID=UPI0033B2088E
MGDDVVAAAQGVCLPEPDLGVHPVRGAHLVALVRAGARFENGVLVEREDQAA